MSWYETQFKNLQVARQRNKQEERRLQLELNRKHGLRAIHEWRLEEVNKEQRMVERELERIRLGIHRVPLQGENFGSLARRQSKRRNRCGAGQEIFVSDSKNVGDNQSPQLNKDNVFLQAIMYVESDMDPLENATRDRIEQSVCADTLAIGFNSPSVPYRDLAVSPRVDNEQKTTFVDNSTPVRYIDVPESETNVEFVPESSVDFASYAKQNIPPKSSASKKNSAGNLAASSPRSQPRVHASPKVKERQAGFSLDLVSLASLDMKSVKSDVARRISQQKPGNQQQTTTAATAKRGSLTADTTSATTPSSGGETKAKERSGAVDDTAEQAPLDVMDDVDAKNPDSARPKERSEKTRRTSKQNQQKEIDPSDYNPDGSLKKMYLLPKFEDSWKEAQRARYIRHGRNSDILERERELSVKEVFDKGSKTKDANH